MKDTEEEIHFTIIIEYFRFKISWTYSETSIFDRFIFISNIINIMLEIRKKNNSMRILDYAYFITHLPAPIYYLFHMLMYTV